MPNAPRHACPRANAGGRFFFLCALLLMSLTAQALDFDLSPAAPVAATKTKTFTAHGDTRSDPYYWLRNKRDPAVRAHLEAENAYATRVLAPTATLQAQLYEEMLARIEETDTSAPVRDGGWVYYSRTVTGLQYPIHCRKAIAADGSWENAPEQVLLDENLAAQGLPFYGVGDFEISPSGRYLAWTEDTTGFRQYRLKVRDLQTGRLLRDSAQRVTSLAWAEDDRTLFFTTEDRVTKRSNQLWRKPLGGKPSLVREERDERFSVSVHITRSRGYLVQSIGSHTSSETWLLPANQPEGRWRRVLPRRADIEYDLDHRGDKLYVRINDTGRNFRLVELPVDAKSLAEGRELIAHRDDTSIEDVALFRDWMVVEERSKGLEQLVVTDLANGQSHTVTMPEPAYSLQLEGNPEFDAPRLRYHYESLTTPDSSYDYDPRKREASLVKRLPVKGDFDPQRYVTERLQARAADGTLIPVSLVRRREVPLDGSAPLWLEGYGAYGFPNDVSFRRSLLPLLDRGMIFAIAHVRGGGELGKPWHDGGRLEHKMNSFTDFIACAEHLVAQGYTRPERLVAEGGSAGGLLMGGITNLRPELFRAVILNVPFVDVLTTMSDASLPLTVAEYEEWGNPAKAREYRWMRAYSPYDNLAARDYPAILVQTSFNDSQVMYWEPAKYIARLRSLRTDRDPTLLVTNLEAGHGGASGRYDFLREVAREFAFALVAVGAAQTAVMK